MTNTTNTSAASGAADNCTILPDGSAFAVGSFPLPQDHWLYAPHEYEPGADEPKELLAPILTHAQRNEVVAAVRYAIRGATMCGKDPDFDPDALVQNAVYALCGSFGRTALATTAQATPAAVAGPSDPSITLDFKQATELLKMFDGDPGLVTLQHGNERSHSGAGLYAWYSDLPEEGAVFLGAEPDDEAAPTTQPAPQQDVSAAGGDSFLLLPTRPTPDAPANTAGLSWDAYSGAQMLAYGRSCSDAALVVAAHKPSPAARGDALDAARYRWLRAPTTDVALVLDKRTAWVPPDDAVPGVGGYWVYEYRAGDDLDEAVDAARAAQKEGESVPAPPPPPPPECETEAEKRAFAFGWFKALESERMKADNKKKDPL